MSHERSATAGIRKTATCAAEARAISAASAIFPRASDEDGAAMLRGIPDDRDDDCGDEELRETDLVREHLERADEDLGDERGHDRGEREHAERLAERPALDLVVGRDVHRRVTAQRVPGDRDVDDEEDDRDRQRDLRERVGVRVPVPAGHRRDEEEERRERDEPEGEKAREPVEAALPARDERGAEDEEEVADHASRQGSAHDVGQPVVDRDQSDDQLGRVAEGRVQEAADPGPVCSAACSVASPINHASGISDTAARTNSTVSGGCTA